jgi:hypothetical protein
VQGLQVWLIGTNYVRIASVSVNDDSTYSYELKPAETQQLASGQYVVLIQHPMMNGRFDIVYNSATGDVTNLISGQKIFQLTGSGSLPSPAGANALIQAINSQNIDDTFASTTFLVIRPMRSLRRSEIISLATGSPSAGPPTSRRGTTCSVENLFFVILADKKDPGQRILRNERDGPGNRGNGGSNLWTFDVDNLRGGKQTSILSRFPEYPWK